MIRSTSTTITHRLLRCAGLAVALLGGSSLGATQASAAPATAVRAPAFTIPHDTVQYADSFVRAFGAKNTGRVRLLGTTTAANNAIAHYSIAGPTWVRLWCDGTAGSLHCKYGNGLGRFMLVNVSNFDAMLGRAHSVTSVVFSRFRIPANSCDYADAFVRAFGAKNTDIVRLLGTTTAASTAIGHYGLAGPTWVRTRCDGAAGSMFVSYRDGRGHRLLVRVSNFDAMLRHPHSVTSIAFS